MKFASNFPHSRIFHIPTCNFASFECAVREKSRSNCLLANFCSMILIALYRARWQYKIDFSLATYVQPVKYHFMPFVTLVRVITRIRRLSNFVTSTKQIEKKKITICYFSKQNKLHSFTNSFFLFVFIAEIIVSRCEESWDLNLSEWRAKRNKCEHFVKVLNVSINFYKTTTTSKKQKNSYSDWKHLVKCR